MVCGLYQRLRSAYAFVAMARKPLSCGSEVARPFLSRLTSRSHHQLQAGFAPDPAEKREEETLPGYRAGNYYPVRLGQVFQDRWKVITKVGYDASSTTWLCRDLKLKENPRVSEPYIDLKISTGIKPATEESHPAVREDRAYHRIKEKMKFTESSGPAWIRAEHDPFEIIGNDGSRHLCRPQKAIVMSLEDTLYHNRRSGYVRLPTLEWFAGITLCSVMEALDFLHNEAHITHCNITAGNIIFAASKAGGEEVFSTFLGEPPHSKIVGPDGRMVFVSQALDWFEFRDHIIGRILPNYGEARIGPRYPHELVQPEPYRAPEIIMGAEWSHAVDIWNLGCLAWDLVHFQHLFYARYTGEYSPRWHLAEIISYLGDPPPELIKRSSPAIQDLFDKETGEWCGPRLPRTSFDEAETLIDEPYKEIFLDFIRQTLTWLPEGRATAAQLVHHPWLKGLAQDR